MLYVKKSLVKWARPYVCLDRPSFLVDKGLALDHNFPSNVLPCSQIMRYSGHFDEWTGHNVDFKLKGYLLNVKGKTIISQFYQNVRDCD